MIFDRFQVARVPASVGVPDIQYLQHTSGYAGIYGSLLVYSSGEVAVGGTNPTALVGIALARANSAPGYGTQNNPTVFTGRQRKIPVARANRVTVFSGYLTNGSATRIAPTVADIGVSYGVTAYSGIWTVDKAKLTTDARVVIIDIDTFNTGVFFKFLEAHLATP